LAAGLRAAGFLAVAASDMGLFRGLF